MSEKYNKAEETNSDASSVEVPPSESAPQAVPVDTPPSGNNAYVPPPGYVLVEQSMYERLMESFTAPSAPATPKKNLDDEGQEKVFYKFRMLRQFVLGSCGVNLTAGEEVLYCRGQYIQINGAKHTKLNSWIQMLRLQYGEKPDPRFQGRGAILEWINEGEVPNPSTLFGSVNGRASRQRVDGDAAYRPSRVEGDPNNTLQATVPPQPSFQDLREGDERVDAQGLPPVGKRREIIAKMNGDQIERPLGSNTGTENVNSEPKTVEDFEVSGRVAHGGTVVAKLDDVADEGKEFMRKQAQKGR